MLLTPNYKLKKPELTDIADITELNSNYDTIDTELKNRRLSTVSVTDANLNNLLADKTYSCAGTLVNTPTPCTFCILEVFDTGAEISGVIVQVCHIPQSNFSVRSYIRSVYNGSIFGAWSELTGVETTGSYLESRVDANTFRFNSLSAALTNQLTHLTINTFETETIDTSLADGLAFSQLFDSNIKAYVKTSNTDMTVIFASKTVTTGNNQAWALLHYDKLSSDTSNDKIELYISRDNGVTYTQINDNVLNGLSTSLTSISTQPAGVSLRIKLIVKGNVRLKNMAYGVK